MKSTIKLLICFLCLSNSLNAQEISAKDILMGKWENKQFEIEYHFNENGVYFSQGAFGQSIEYTLDVSKTPIWLDFTINIGNYKNKINGLLEIIDKDTIVIEQFSPSSKHPTEFSENRETINKRHTLKRMPSN